MGKHQRVKRPNKLLRFFAAFPKLVDHFFNWYGAFIADHSIWFIAIPLLATFVLAPGIMQLQRLTDDMKIWPITNMAGFTINSITAKTTFNSYPSICTCVRCDDYGENCNRTIDCGDEVPKACKGAADGVDFTCPHIQLMLVSRNLSMTDPAMVEELMELDMLLTFGKYSIQKFKPAFFTSNESNWQICQTREDGSCIQFSVLTGVRQQLSKLPGLSTFEAQNQFLMDLQSDPEKQQQFRDMMQSQADKPTYYPFDSSQPNAQFTGPIYGAVTMERQNETWRNGFRAGKVKHIGAMQFLYCLNDTESVQDTNMNWTRYITNWLETRYTNNKTFKKFDLMVASSWSRLDRTGDEIVRCVPYLIICVASLMLFCGIATLRGFPVHRTMPWIGVVGVGCSVLGIGASFGLVGWMQMQIVDLCFAIPVLVLAVGIDDIFVYTEAWRSTKSEWLVRKRVSVTMRTAAAGIVVTSFMNSLAFIIDTQTPFNALQIFSNVAVVCATFDFVFQMTLFPAVLAVMNSSEKKNRHACCCCCTIKARTNSDYRKQGFCYLVCCTAPKSTILKQDEPGVELAKKAAELNKIDDDKKEDVILAINKKVEKPKPPIEDDDLSITSKSKESQKSMHFFKDIYTPFLLKKHVTIVVLVVYGCYFVICGYLLATQLHVGLRFEHMAPDRKGGKLNEVQVWLKYFRNFSFPIDVMFNEPLDYWNASTQRHIDALFEDLLKVPNIGPDIVSRNWLRDFVSYAKLRSMDISTEESFLYYLRQHFFREAKVRQDMMFDVKFADRLIPNYEEDYEVDFHGWKLPRIVSSRLLIYAVNVNDMTLSAETSRRLITVRRKHEENYLSDTYYSREFVDTEPLLATAWVVVYNTLVQMAAILLITSFMMPHPVALFWITIMLSSITIGVIAFACSWGVDFDQIAMVNIMLTMGYCVDFTAHMTRTYVASKGKTRLDKTQEALGEFGYAVILSSIAAILAVLSLASSYAYILRSGFTFFFIGILLSDFHTLIIFPVLLLHLGPPPQAGKKKRKDGKDKQKRHDKSKDDVDLEAGSIDARKIAKEFDRSLKLEQQKQDEKQLIEIASIYSAAKQQRGFSWAADGGSVASGPIKRVYIPDLTQVPPLDEMVETEIIVKKQPLSKLMDINKTFILTQKGELTMSSTADTTAKSSSIIPSSTFSSNYEKPPRF